MKMASRLLRGKSAVMNSMLTPWEKRNLGVESSIEFYVDQNDAWEDIVGELQRHRELYQVMHIASGNTDVLWNAGKIGFLPVEMNIQLSKRLDEVTLPRLYRRFEPNISCEAASEEEKRWLLDVIAEGSIFSTDKVARDPHFGCRCAGQRYAHWTREVLDRGAELLCMKYKGRIAAFDVLIDKGNGVADAFLGGTVPEFSAGGLGFLSVYFITKTAMERGFRKITTGVSSNNAPILKLHEMFGYGVESMSYCMIKHLGEETG